MFRVSGIQVNPKVIITCSNSSQKFQAACAGSVIAEKEDDEYDVETLTVSSFSYERGRHKLSTLGTKAGLGE